MEAPAKGRQRSSQISWASKNLPELNCETPCSNFSRKSRVSSVIRHALSRELPTALQARDPILNQIPKKGSHARGRGRRRHQNLINNNRNGSIHGTDCSLPKSCFVAWRLGVAKMARDLPGPKTERDSPPVMEKRVPFNFVRNHSGYLTFSAPSSQPSWPFLSSLNLSPLTSWRPSWTYLSSSKLWPLTSWRPFWA